MDSGCSCCSAKAAGGSSSSPLRGIIPPGWTPGSATHRPRVLGQLAKPLSAFIQYPPGTVNKNYYLIDEVPHISCREEKISWCQGLPLPLCSLARQRIHWQNAGSAEWFLASGQFIPTCIAWDPVGINLLSVLSAHSVLDHLLWLLL